MSKRNIVKLDTSLRNWVSSEYFDKVDFRDLFRVIVTRCVHCDISGDLKFTYTAFGEKFDDIKSAVAFVTEYMLKSMQFIYAWSHMSDDEFRSFSNEFELLSETEDDEIAQRY